MRVDEIYATSPLLNAQRCTELDLWEKPMKVKEITVRTLRDKQKIVLTLEYQNSEYNLVLNRTNAVILAEAWGYDTDDWKGRVLRLRKVKRNYQGRLVDGVEVQPVEEGKGKK